jgi:hypothetical protein
MYLIQHCFICSPSDSTVSYDSGIEVRTVATLALAVRRCNRSARYRPRLIEGRALERLIIFVSSYVRNTGKRRQVVGEIPAKN